MAREIVEHLWCDPHLRRHEERVPGKEYRVSFNGGKTMLFEACVDCYDTHVRPFEEFVSECGRPERFTKEGEPVAKTGKREYCEVPGCGKHYSTKYTLKKHKEDAHNIFVGTPRVNQQPKPTPRTEQKVYPARVMELLAEADRPISAAELTRAMGLKKANSSQVRIILQREGALGRKIVAKTNYAKPVVWARSEDVLRRPHELEAAEGYTEVPLELAAAG